MQRLVYMAALMCLAFVAPGTMAEAIAYSKKTLNQRIITPKFNKMTTTKTHAKIAQIPKTAVK